MSMKELTAWVMTISAVAVSGWLVWELSRTGFAATPQAAAMQALWAIGYTIAFNIVGVIVGTILVAIVTRNELKDEKSDERDKLVAGMGMRNGYFVLSVSVGLLLVAQALGWVDAVFMPYGLFFASMLAGGVFAVSQVIFYRVG